MHYITLEGESVKELKEKLIREYGEDAYVIKVEQKKKGLLKKTRYVMIAGIRDEDYLQKQKKEILKAAKNKKIVNQENRKFSSNENQLATQNDPEDYVFTQDYEQTGYSYNQNNEEISNKLESSLLAQKLEKIEKKLDEMASSNIKVESVLDKYIDSLSALDYSKDFQQEIFDYLSRNLSYEESNSIEKIRKKTLDYIESKIKIDDKRISKDDIAVLVGPTGVGKTTTIVKLATNAKVNQNFKIKLLSADQAKIGGYAHLQIAAEILQVPFYPIVKKDDYISMISEKDDVIFVDSPGTSQKDSKMLGSIKEILDVRKKNIKTFLTISATTKYGDLIDIFERFKFLNYNHLIITKIDETSSFGQVISAITKYDIPISYITNGQEMTKNLIEPDSNFILKLAFNSEDY
ncbi:MAG: AAA family ATPase [Spirochaetales bacterium]|jgi:flagellar biosynthesis protein FlhF|nr:AAA family ATPase [Exilispira sp.]NMC67089.1 AAA family ATPase [Spirochaetales bacterium]